ncbi:DUF475 domain-containing protein [Candidatus Kaiserbacteria bacterium]|nr:DUF475 domain-containing protein [Candidatus Kaiserbacteria bacterium]
MRVFIFPAAVAFLVCVATLVWGGVDALVLMGLLAILETTLSFDNAIINAKVLARMDKRWQTRFLTWGIPVAVFGTRFVLPILIVSAAVGIAPLAVATLAFFEPAVYTLHLQQAHVAIASFGSTFLFLVSLKYFLDERKKIHWIRLIEPRLAKWGGIDAIEVAVVLSALLTCAFLLPADRATILLAGVVGVVLFILVQGIAQSFELETGAAVGSIALFVYLNVLDAAFSLDGVIGAFAITPSLPVIIAGLGIGALFVRSFTVYLVRAKTLESLIYLEHGAHWAIFGLALAMLLGIFVHVPEALTGLVGAVVIMFAYISSRREIQRSAVN